MNYKLSENIKNEISKRQKFIINCHKGPDHDSVASCTTLAHILEKTGKDVFMVCPDNLPEETRFIRGSSRVKTVDMSKFSYGNFDAFLILDTSNWGMINPDANLEPPDIFKIVIDHHDGNQLFGDINLVDKNATSTCEVLYKVLKDWELKIDAEYNYNLLAGILSDSGGLQYNKTSSQTLRIAADLVDSGVNLKSLVLKLFRSYSIDLLRLCGELMSKIQMDEKHKFAWVAVDYDTLNKYPDIVGAKSFFANLFIRSIENTHFGIVIVEKQKGIASVSFRERDGFNVLKIAKKLGGGGHKSACGTVISDISFDQAVNKVLDTTRETLE